MIHTPDLSCLEGVLQSQFSSLADPLRHVCAYAVEGGQRVRASLLLATAHTTDERAVRAAVALELLHGATLVQDDIFDRGELRRGRPATHLRFGTPLALLASDWMLVRSLQLAAAVDSSFFRCVSGAALAMAESVATELQPAAVTSIAEAQQMSRRIAEGKTAALFGAALCGAATLRGLPDVVCARWQKLGLEVGLTYQMVDDCEDLYGNQANAGKTLGHDLEAGCFTYPILLGALHLIQQGTILSLAELQHGGSQLNARQDLLLSTQSEDTRQLLLQMLEKRFALHVPDAEVAGIPAGSLEPFLHELRRRTLRYLKPTSEPHRVVHEHVSEGDSSYA